MNYRKRKSSKLVIAWLVIVWFVRIMVILALGYGGLAGIHYIADHGVKNIVERVWEGPAK